MIDLGVPLRAADTVYIRSRVETALECVRDPFSWAAWWPGVRTFDQKLSGDVAQPGDAWCERALLGRRGLDVERVVTDIRAGEHANVWMDLRGHVDPVVGLPLGRQAFEAESEFYVRPNERGLLFTILWSVRSEPERAQQNLLRALRRHGWAGMNGLKRHLESAVI